MVGAHLVWIWFVWACLFPLENQWIVKVKNGGSLHKNAGMHWGALVIRNSWPLIFSIRIRWYVLFGSGSFTTDENLGWDEILTRVEIHSDRSEGVWFGVSWTDARKVGPLQNYVLVSSIFCYFHPYLGKIPILTTIFQMGWNHQLVIFTNVGDHETLKITSQNT